MTWYSELGVPGRSSFYVSNIFSKQRCVSRFMSHRISCHRRVSVVSCQHSEYSMYCQYFWVLSNVYKLPALVVLLMSTVGKAHRNRIPMRGNGKPNVRTKLDLMFFQGRLHVQSATFGPLSAHSFTGFGVCGLRVHQCLQCWALSMISVPETQGATSKLRHLSETRFICSTLRYNPGMISWYSD